MNVPCVICDLIADIRRISNVLEHELLAYRFSEFLWLGFLRHRVYFPWGYLGKRKIYEQECYRTTALHSTRAACIAPHAETELQRGWQHGSGTWGGGILLAKPA